MFVHCSMDCKPSIWLLWLQVKENIHPAKLLISLQLNNQGLCSIKVEFTGKYCAAFKLPPPDVDVPTLQIHQSRILRLSFLRVYWRRQWVGTSGLSFRFSLLSPYLLTLGRYHHYLTLFVMVWSRYLLHSEPNSNYLSLQVKKKKFHSKKSLRGTPGRQGNNGVVEIWRNSYQQRRYEQLSCCTTLH